MSRFRFELATEADDAGLRDVLARTPMGGNIQVTFRREPSYFAAAPVDGPFRQVVICREVLSRRIIGFGLRAVRRMYVNGEPRDIGYLGSLRVLEEYRNQGLVARGYAFFRKLHEDGRTPLYLTTIAEGNTKAIETLASGRAGLPRYHFAGLYHTAVFPLENGVLADEVEHEPVPFASASVEDLPAIVAFLNREGSRRQFFPFLRLEDFTTPDGMMLGLAPEDIFLRRDAEGHISGVVAAWDQAPFKQTVVETYSGALRWLRPFLDLGAWFGFGTRLPAPGCLFRYRTVTLPVLPGDGGESIGQVLELLGYTYCLLPHEYLLLGMHERDPLWPHVLKMRPRVYTTRLYLVCWDDGEELRQSLDDRVPYLELGTL